MHRILSTILQNPRIRGEAGWVVTHKLAEFGVVFLALKLFTNLMPEKVFGEFNIALTTLMFLANLTVIPIGQAFYRRYHGAESDGSARATLLQTMTWLALITLGILVLGAILTNPLSHWFGLEKYTVLAIALVFLGNRWRSFWIGLLDVQRNRRLCAIQNVGFFLTQCGLVALAMLVFTPAASTALLAYALAAAVFGVIGIRSLSRNLRDLPPGAPANLGIMVWQFGLPLGALLTCQWVQTFAERYVLGIQLDLETVGRYVAAYQVCGIPFMLTYAILNTLVVPIAYQRAKSLDDPEQLRAADRILLAGIAMYIAIGPIALIGYYFCGEWLMRLLTSAGYIVEVKMMLLIAAARYVAFLGLLWHTIFKVHQRMRALLLFSIIGAAVAVPTSWVAVEWYGMTGAAIGILATGLIYNILMIVAPGGCLTLLRPVFFSQPAPPMG